MRKIETIRVKDSNSIVAEKLCGSVFIGFLDDDIRSPYHRLISPLVRRDQFADNVHKRLCMLPGHTASEMPCGGDCLLSKGLVLREAE